MSAEKNARVRPLRQADLSFSPGPALFPDPALLHAFATDPDGVFAAPGEGGGIVGYAAGIVRGETLQAVSLYVEPRARSQGLGRALFDAVRAYGRSRGTRVVEALSPCEPAALAFFLLAGLPIRSLVLTLERSEAGGKNPAPADSGLEKGVAVREGALSGWVADLDRETRGFARTPEWTRWKRIRGAEVVALMHRGRPEAVGALLPERVGLSIGPIEGKTPEGARELLALLTAQAPRSARLTLTVPAESRAVLEGSRALGFVLTATHSFFSSRPRGDFRRYASSSSPLF